MLLQFFRGIILDDDCDILKSCSEFFGEFLAGAPGLVRTTIAEIFEAGA